jgi:hypothetical protein
MAKKKRTFGVSPKGALVLREREEQRRRNLPRVEVIRDGAVKRVEENPLLKLMAEFPMLPPIDIDFAVDPGLAAALDYSLSVVRGGVTRNKLPTAMPFTGAPYITRPESVDITNADYDICFAHAPVFMDDKAFSVVVPKLRPLDVFPLNNKFSCEFVESDTQPISNWLKTWYPDGGGMPFVIKPEDDAPDRLRYKMRRANASAEVGFADNNYRDFVDVIHSWYTRDGAQQEYRLYTSEVKICADMEKLTKYFSDFRERCGMRLSGLEIRLGFEVDNRFTLMVTEVFQHEQAMLLLEVVTTIPNMRPLGFVRFFKDPGTLRANNESEHDISWTFNTFFSDFNVFGRDQLSQFLDIVVYCLDKGVREDISYYG